MSDEYTIDAKYKRDNLIDEHYRYEQALHAAREALKGEWANPRIREALQVIDKALGETDG